jgi:hypothetical protein
MSGITATLRTFNQLQVWYLENIVEEEVLFLQSLVIEFLGLSWLEIADLLSMYKTLVGYHFWKQVSC